MREQMLEQAVLLQEPEGLSRRNPERNSFSTSSNSRAGGTPSSKYASRRIGASVSGSMEKPSFAAKRTARSMRTGSSR